MNSHEDESDRAPGGHIYADTHENDFAYRIGEPAMKSFYNAKSKRTYIDPIKENAERRSLRKRDTLDTLVTILLTNGEWTETSQNDIY